MTIEDFLDRLDNVSSHAGGYKALCPAHEDHTASLGVSEGEDDVILVQCYAGCRTDHVMEALGLSMADLFPGNRGSSLGDPVAVYPYVDENGVTLFEACRFEGKKFRQRHVNEEGETVYSLEGVRRILFNLPNVIEAIRLGHTIYIVEGEKDVLTLAEHGITATCNPMGAGKWRPEYTDTLQNCAGIVIVSDKDDIGRHHAERIKNNLREVGVHVIVVEAKEGKDATDHFEAGYGVEDFVPLVERARRGIVTAREMAENGIVHMKAEEGSVPEYVIPDFSFGKHSLSMRQGRPYLLGGYTSDGKTTISLQIVRSLCSSAVPPRVGFFSMEMSADDLRNRLIEHMGIPLYNIEHPWHMTDQQKILYGFGMEQIRDWPLEIIFDTQLGAEAICDVTRDRDYDFVFVDHIHRFSWGGERRQLESEIAKLTNLALDFNIPVFVLAQLRSRQQGQGKFVQFPKPTINEFKETSVLGEEAAMALAIWRHRLQDTTYDPSGMSELVILKNRYGPPGSAMLRLDTKRMIFTPGGVTNVGHNGAAVRDEGSAEEAGEGESGDSLY